MEKDMVNNQELINLSDIPRNSRGNIRWSSLVETPEILYQVLEMEARQLVVEGIDPSEQNLKKAKKSVVAIVISKHYPGSYYGLREKLGIPNIQRSRGFWGTTEGHEELRQQAKMIYEQEGRLSGVIFRKLGRNDLDVASQRYYPGKMSGLLKDLGISKNKKPKGYFTPKVITQEARLFHEEHGVLNHKALVQQGRADLRDSITRKYPGGMTRLKENLGIKIDQRPTGYWTPEVTQQEAKVFFAQHSTLELSALRKAKRHDLINAIRDYQGGLKQLRVDLGIDTTELPFLEMREHTFVGQQGKFISNRVLAEEFGLRETTIDSLLKDCAQRECLRAGRDVVVLYLESEARKILEVFTDKPTVNDQTRVYCDDQGEVWVTKRSYCLANGLSIIPHKLLKGVNFIEGRSPKNKRRVSLYNKKNLDEKLSEILNSPIIDPETGVYVDQTGISYAPVGVLSKKYNISTTTLRELQGITILKGRSKHRLALDLYSEPEVVIALSRLKRFKMPELTLTPEEANEDLDRLFEI